MERSQVNSTSLSLLARARRDEPDAWDRLTALYVPLVYSWCRKCQLSPEDSADLTQDVFVRVANNLAQFRRERANDSFRGWLYTITRNVVRTHAKKLDGEAVATGGTAARLKIEQLPQTEHDPSVDTSGLASDPVIRRGLELVQAEFEPKTWTAFWRFAVDGVKAVDVGAELGVTAGAVRKAKMRVMRRLQAEFGDLMDMPAI